MNILLNGERYRIDDGTTVRDLIGELGLKGRLAVEVNGEIVPRSAYEAHVLEVGDRVEIVHAIGGGAL